MSNEERLETQINDTFFSLRWGMCVIAFCLPLFLWLYGESNNSPWPKASISAYYESPVVRDCFVGALFAIAACLHLYKGFTKLENVLLNMAGLFAVGVAVFPWDKPPSWWPLPASSPLAPHGICAVLFFIMIACACWFCKEASLVHSNVPPARKAQYRAKYNLLGVALVALPCSAFCLEQFVDKAEKGTSIFFTETAAMWVFALYWYTKSGELKEAMKKFAERVTVRVTSSQRAAGA